MFEFPVCGYIHGREPGAAFTIGPPDLGDRRQRSRYPNMRQKSKISLVWTLCDYKISRGITDMILRDFWRGGASPARMTTERRSIKEIQGPSKEQNARSCAIHIAVVHIVHLAS